MSHPANSWLEKQADRIGAKGLSGHTLIVTPLFPNRVNFNFQFTSLMSAWNANVRRCSNIPSLDNKALILHAGNMYRNDYGRKAYFDETDMTIQNEVLLKILDKSPQLILIDSYGIGKHGGHHQELDKICEALGCYVVENIRIAPEDVAERTTILVKFDLDYPSKWSLWLINGSVLTSPSARALL